MMIPTPAEIALALSVVKTKPPGRTVADFVLGFRNAIACPEQGGGLTIDLCTYWHNESHRLQDELDKSVAICAVLRAETQKDVDIDIPDPPSRKHKGESLSEGRVVKRARALKQAEADDGQALQERQLMGMLFELRKRQAASPTDAGTLSACLCQTASTLEGIISKNSQTTYGSKPDVPDVLRVAPRVIVCLLQGVDTLNLQSVSSIHSGGALYAMVHLFSTILERIVTCQRALHSLSHITHKEKSDHTSPLAGLLEAMYESLDMNKHHHAELYEGFTYHLIQRIGKTLHILTPAPDEPQPSLTDQQASLYVGTPLLSVLSTALRLAPRSFRTSRTQTQHVDSTLPLLSRHSLTTKALAKLQRTLVHATLGEALDPLDASAERICAPKSPPITTTSRRRTTAKRKDPTPQEQADAWKAELWSCLGWDILAYEGRLATLLSEQDGTK